MAERGKIDPRKRRRGGAAHTVIRLAQEIVDDSQQHFDTGGVAAQAYSIGGSSGVIPDTDGVWSTYQDAVGNSAVAWMLYYATPIHLALGGQTLVNSLFYFDNTSAALYIGRKTGKVGSTRWYADDDKYVSVQSPSGMAADTPYTWPNAYPPVDTGYSLSSNTSGALSWESAGGGGSYIALSDTGAGYGTNLQVPKTDGTSAIAWGWVDWAELVNVPATFPPSAHTHPIYMHIDGSTPFTGTVAGLTPVADADLATKKYVDDNEIDTLPEFVFHATVTVTGDMTVTSGRNIFVPIDASLGNIELQVLTLGPGYLNTGFTFIFKRMDTSANTCRISFIDGLDGTVNWYLDVFSQTLSALNAGGAGFYHV